MLGRDRPCYGLAKFHKGNRMVGRRLVIGSSAAVLAAGEGIASTKASAATGFSGDIEPRGTIGRLERLPTLELESLQDFLTTFRAWTDSNANRAASARANALCKARGLDANGDLDLGTVVELLKDDPVIQTGVRAWISCQQLTWQYLRDEFHGKADIYLAEMEKADHAGPGTLELNPEMAIPDYTKHEIHLQPGGYVGDPFAGHVYHYGTNNFYKRSNDQDNLHVKYAAALPVPSDGKVRRILELGCGVGQMTVALKQRFPDAEVWGIDVGGPLVRYAHMRAVEQGADVNFAQRLAEDTRFPAGHFDMVTCYILFHEVTASAAAQIVREAHRVLRPGGVFFPIDFYTGSNKVSPNAAAKFRHWWDHRWNNEVWWNEYEQLDLPATMRLAGFAVDESGPPAWIGTTNLLGIRNA